ncbi:hypothetical protein diail_10766 [Diaporthe ilicicola]|nr:hypothetical protein diail_10766 [Diaporthe ilicicola]
MCFPASYIASEGFSLSQHEIIKDADVLFLLDCDVPWIPSRNAPSEDAKIYHVDCDPFNQQIPVFFFPAHGRWKADSLTAFIQLVDYFKSDATLTAALRNPKYSSRRNARADVHKARLAYIAAQPRLDAGEILDVHNVSSILKLSLPDSTTFVVEAVTASIILHDHLQPSRPGSWINCGGTGIGWSNGAALGVQMALADLAGESGSRPDLVCHVVGDGSFMCAAPSSALWVASKYEIPVLTVVLNNGGMSNPLPNEYFSSIQLPPLLVPGFSLTDALHILSGFSGWKAPRNSTRLVYPEGLNTTASDDEINVSFRPTPNYAALAEAAAGSEAGWENNATSEPPSRVKGVRVRMVEDLREALRGAVSRVVTSGKGMLVEVLM